VQNSFNRELARSLVIMLLEMQAETREFAYQMDLEEQRCQAAHVRSGSKGSPFIISDN
jgi:hypothetical protein